MTGVAFLESFDAAAPTETATAQAKEESYRAGFADGQTAAKAEANTLNAELVQAISDLEFKYEEVKGEVTQSLRPFLKTLATQVFPHFAQTAFLAQIVQVLQTIAQTATTGPLSLSVHPNQAGAISEAIATATLKVRVVPDAALAQNTARVAHAGEETQVDTADLIARISAILSAEATPSQKDNANE